MSGEAGKGLNKTLHISPKYKSNFDNIDWSDDGTIKEHIHKFDPINNICSICGMSYEELYINASGEYPI